MKSVAFTFDRRLYDLLQEQGRTSFTTVELRDAYAESLGVEKIRLADVRLYVYDQIRRMLRVGWVLPDGERRVRGQVYHLQPMPNHLKLELVTGSFEKACVASDITRSEPGNGAPLPGKTSSSVSAGRALEMMQKETRMEFLCSMGEAAGFKQILDEIPHLKDKVEAEYLEARDRSSRLLGHLRAIEKTLETLAASR